MREAWEDTSAITRFEITRNTVGQAFQTNLQKIVDDHVPVGTILEIGSGIGALRNRVTLPERRRLFTSVRGKFIHLDASESFSGIMKSAHPESDIVVGDAYSLPFPDKSINGVIALDVFDVFQKLQTALQEIQKVLKKGEKIVHILDLIPNPNRLLVEISQSQHAVLPGIPVNTGLLTEIAWRVTTPKEVDTFLQSNRLPPRLKGKLLRYLRNILIEPLQFDSDDYKALAKGLQRAGFPGSSIPLSHLFSQRLMKEMGTAGFTDISQENYTTQAIVPKTDVHRKKAGNDKKINVFLNVIGNQDTAHVPTLPDDHVLEVSVVQCITGRKR